MQSAPILFISDLHLTQDRPLPATLFHEFMAEVAPQAGALYILGDFFETWVGDDELSVEFNARVVRDLSELSRSGIPIFFLPGNRDFLVGEDFAHTAGLTLLTDPVRINLFGTPTLLSHGDIFCTDDAAYQTFRNQVRDRIWQAEFLAKSWDERRSLARALREHSELAKADKKPEIMDVNTEALDKSVREQDIRRIIHGHTHRPARHEFKVNGKTVERWVLPDWFESGGYLRCDDAGCRLAAFPGRSPIMNRL